MIAKVSSGLRHSRLFWASVLGAVFSFAAGSASATEVLVSTSTQENIEFDHDDGLVEWVDKLHNLWVAQVDPTTGNFIPSSGQGTLVDNYVAFAGTWGNGPEFVKSTSGYSMVYNKIDKWPTGSTPQQLSAWISSAAHNYLQRADYVNGAWTTNNDVNPFWAATSMHGWVEPEGNNNPTQTDPPFVFYNGYQHNDNGNNCGTCDTSSLYIMGIHDFAPITVPGTANTLTQGSARFVPGLNQLVYTQNVTVNGSTVRQAFSYDVASGTVTQLTFDATNKGDIFMFQAPEFNNAYVMMLSINRQFLQFYTYQYNKVTKTSAWTIVYTINPPQGSGAPKYLFSPEAFFYKNKTYVYMVRSPVANSATLAYPTDIWVASMDGTFWNRASNSSTTNPMVRNDPKYYITTSGIWIYWLEYTVASTGAQSQPYGTWKGLSGIPL